MAAIKECASKIRFVTPSGPWRRAPRRFESACGPIVLNRRWQEWKAVSYAFKSKIPIWQESMYLERAQCIRFPDRHVAPSHCLRNLWTQLTILPPKPSGQTRVLKACRTFYGFFVCVLFLSFFSSFFFSFAPQQTATKSAGATIGDVTTARLQVGDLAKRCRFFFFSVFFCPSYVCVNARIYDSIKKPLTVEEGSCPPFVFRPASVGNFRTPDNSETDRFRSQREKEKPNAQWTSHLKVSRRKCRHRRVETFLFSIMWNNQTSSFFFCSRETL